MKPLKRNPIIKPFQVTKSWGTSERQLNRHQSWRFGRALKATGRTRRNARIPSTGPGTDSDTALQGPRTGSDPAVGLLPRPGLQA